MLTESRLLAATWAHLLAPGLDYWQTRPRRRHRTLTRGRHVRWNQVQSTFGVGRLCSWQGEICRLPCTATARLRPGGRPVRWVGLFALWKGGTSTGCSLLDETTRTPVGRTSCLASVEKHFNLPNLSRLCVPSPGPCTLIRGLGKGVIACLFYYTISRPPFVAT